MKVPFSALKEFIAISSSAQEIADVLTLAGIEVEGIEHRDGDAILDLSLTPNLGHCLSIRGLARQLAALLDVPLKQSSFSFEEQADPIEQWIHVSLIDTASCQRYACRIITGVKAGPSPAWLKQRLEACGLRSINTIVDVGNLVMLIYGQPLHMFDYDKIGDKRLLITAQTAYPSLETLDGVKRTIPPDSVLIADPQKPLAFAGVMGGLSSAVTEQTTTVLIESAYFTPRAIRKSSKHLNLKSDASHRFERGVDPNGVIEALNAAVYYLQQVAGGFIAKGYSDTCVRTFHPKKIACRIARVNALLGTTFSLREASTFLKRLGMDIEEKQTELVAAVPTFRHDIGIEEDLIEEIALMYGYNAIPKSSALHAVSQWTHTPLYTFQSRMRRRLIAEGLQEFLCCDLISPTQAEALFENSLAEQACIEVLHAKSIEQSVLRTSLLAGLMQSVKYNIDHSQPDIGAFELGRIYFKQDEHFFEQNACGIILTGKSRPYHWDPKPQPFDFFDLKGIVENLLAAFHIPLSLESSHLHHFHPGRQAYIVIEGARIGALGEVHPAIAQKFGIEERCYFAEYNLHELFLRVPQKQSVADAPLFPGSERDWTLTLSDDIPLGRILEAIRESASPLLQNVILLDLYKSELIGKNKKNVTLRFFYRDLERTLAFETVEKEHAHMIQAVVGRLK